MRRLRYCARIALTVFLAIMPGETRAHPTAVFFPGQAFCPPRTLVVGAVVVPQRHCFSLFVMSITQGVFLGFVPAGLFVVPLGQNIGVTTSLGARIRARALLLLPVVLPGFFVAANAIRFEAFQVEDMGGQLGVRLSSDPETLVPITPSSRVPDPSGAPAGASGMPVPSDLHVYPPNRDIPQDEAAFSGRWTGPWKGPGEGMADEGLPHLLAIEQIIRDDSILRSERRVAAVFAWGRSSRWDVLPGWLRAEGVFQRGILILTLPNGVHASYRMSIDGTLDATYESPVVGVMRAALSRMR